MKQTPSISACGVLPLVPQTKDLKLASQRFKEKTCLAIAFEKAGQLGCQNKRSWGRLDDVGAVPRRVAGLFCPYLYVSSALRCM